MRTLDLALDKYTLETLPRVYERTHLQQISRLETTTFTNREVQSKFRINVQSARNRIRAWIDAGIAAQTGTRAAEGDSGGKPAHEYSIVDSRVSRMLSRSLSLGPDFDLGGDVDPEAESIDSDA